MHSLFLHHCQNISRGVCGDDPVHGTYHLLIVVHHVGHLEASGKTSNKCKGDANIWIEHRCLLEHLNGSISNLLSVILMKHSLSKLGENLTEDIQSLLLINCQGVRSDKFWDKSHHFLKILFHIPRSQQ